MGYERLFRLATVTFTPEDKKKLKLLLKTPEHEFTYLFNDRTKWYDFQVNIQTLSKNFPNTLFYGAYVGEALTDNEYIIFHQGFSMPHLNICELNGGFKLPLNDKVIELTEIVRKIEEKYNRKGKLGLSSDSDDDYNAEEALSDELWEERKKLIDNFFESLNLVEISYLFEDDDDDGDDDDDNDDK